MSATRPRLQARSRASFAAKCPRMAAYALLGVAPEEERMRDDVRALMRLDLDGLRRRGRRIGAARADQYAARYGEENILREKEFVWSAGVGHGDIYVIPERLGIEVKSCQPGSIDAVFDAAVLQVAFAIHYDDDIDSGLVEFVSPVDEFVHEAVPVTLNDELVARVEAVSQAVAQAGLTQGKELPERVCARPGDSASRLCPFAAHCFADWTAPEPESLDDPELVALVLSLYELKRDYKRFNAEAEERKQGYGLMQAALAELGLEPGREYLIGGFKVKRIVSKGRETFSLAKAKSTGQWTPLDDERLGGFVKIGEPSERWSIDQVAASAAPAADFGPDAPWTEADL